MAKLVLLPLLLATTLAVAGCKSSAEKAEDYYQSGLSYLEKGDDERALLEFRNTFQYDGFHKEARRTYAQVLTRQGKLSEAYAQYLRLVEQYPDDVDARRILAELSLENTDWEEARRHGEAALKLAPDAPELVPVRLSLAYQSAALLRDDAARLAVVEEAQKRLDSDLAGNLHLRRIMIDHYLTAGDNDKVLGLADAILADDPSRFDLQMLRYSILVERGDQAAVGTQLKAMAELFPEDERVRGSLIDWYIRSGDVEGAEAYMRASAGPQTGETAPHMALVRTLARLKGPEAARAELEALRKANAGTPLAEFYGTELARMQFGSGDAPGAIAALRQMLEGVSESEHSRAMRVALAQMLDATGEKAEAKTIVASVLEGDRSNVGALKLRASWAISEDRPAEAIVDLRSALDQAPRDSDVLTLMAEAHERDGSPDLAGERLALALEVSGGALPETMRYVSFLMSNDRLQVASRVLGDALQRFPQNSELLSALTDLYIREKLWDRAAETLQRLEALDLSETGKAVVLDKRAAILAGQNRTDDALALFDQAAGDDADLRKITGQLRMQVQAGRIEEARASLDEHRAARPDEMVLRMLDAALSAAEGQFDRAESLWREMIAQDPQAVVPVQSLYTLLNGLGRADEAAVVLDEALARITPTPPLLSWMKAGEFERAGKIEEAIAIYEGLYEKDSANLVVANNLASLITAHRADPESLERAERIARRLRGQQMPAFQDTYGWIAFRRGNLDEALSHLEPAAKGLPEDAVAQMHLGLLYEKLNRPAEAKAQLERALELGSTGPELATLAQAREALERLKSAPQPAKP